MTRKEAFLTALRLETPDVVPVAPLIHSRYADRLLGRDDWRAVFELHQKLGSTAFRGPIGVSYRTEGESPWRHETRVLREEGTRVETEEIITGPGGSMRAVDVRGMIPHDPVCSKRTEYPVKRPEDWAVVRGMYESMVERHAGPAFDSAAEAFEVMGEDGVPSVALGCIFQMLGHWRGMQALLYDLYDIPDVIRSVCEIMAEHSRLAVEAFLAAPNEVAWLDICWATGAHMGPAMFAEWIMPDVRMVCEMVRAVPGKFIGLYTLGRIRAILPMMVDAGPHFIETFEPNEGDISLREAKRLYGRDTCICGNFDCVILARGTPEESRREALRCLDEAMAGGGYIMVSGDEVPADARWDNLVAWVETVREHGRY
ncbi:MAG: uroporphyrinogen decarboxylase family protein [Armatimonadota bacterium]